MMIRHRGHARAQLDMPRSLGRRRNEHFGRADQLEAAGMMFADPDLVEPQPVHMLHQLQVTMEGPGGVLSRRVPRRKERSKLHTHQSSNVSGAGLYINQSFHQ